VGIKDELGEGEVVSQRALRDRRTLGGKDHGGLQEEGQSPHPF
jgi:hypothetical protein